MSARKPKYQTWGSLAIDPDYGVWNYPVWKKPKLRPYSAVKQNQLFTCEEFLEMDLPEGRRFELHDGVIYMMAAPEIQHARIIRNLNIKIYTFLEGKECEVFDQGINVRLKPQEADKHKYFNVYIPDIVVICDKEKLHKKEYDGAPPFIIEVLSPSTSKVDKVDKRRKYEEAGVKEYWIVSPHDRTVETFVLKDGRYEQNCYGMDEENMDVVVPVTVFPGLVIPLRDIFTE
jgi:Uma2 family endonuclease